jgi:hypothetical protein
VIYAAKLFSEPAQITRPSTNIAVLEIVCVLAGNVFSMAVGILSLVFYNDTIVKNYFASLNGNPASVAVSVDPSAPHQPDVAPSDQEPAPGEDEAQS